jgi:8-oxo-dGTP pyrophosphatase MutT (NUDIX family)
LTVARRSPIIARLPVPIDDVRRALGRHAPRVLAARRQAAVAVVLHERPSGAELLFIERARHPLDPWSGHMAFPGGRVDPEDAGPQAAAERETREEVGLDLAGAELLGRLDDLHAGIRVVSPLVLSAFVYRIDATPTLRPNHEVETALWVPARLLLDPARHVGWRWGPARVPGILVGEPDRHVVWGLTYQLVESLFRVVGRPLPRG